MARLPLKPSVVKKLFALSGNICAFPNCKNNIVDQDMDLIGEICHIEGAESGSPRYNENSNDEQRRSFENLILLCSIHHVKTNNVEAYTTEKLKEMKHKHESNFINNKFVVTNQDASKFIKQMKQRNKNIGSGVQFNNQAETQNITNQIGTQSLNK